VISIMMSIFGLRIKEDRISKVYTPTVAAHPNDLYTVTVTAVSADGVTTSSTWTFRTY